MTVSLRLTSKLYAAIHSDLRRQHAFAFERVAFVFGRQARLRDGIAVVLTTFAPVLDEHYEEDESVGARIGRLAINRALAMAAALGAAAFHIHAHPHRGRPRFSSTDLRELPDVMTPFQYIVRDQPRGLLVLSDDDCQGLVWFTGDSEPRPEGSPHQTLLLSTEPRAVALGFAACGVVRTAHGRG